jgi:hypothetical protein
LVSDPSPDWPAPSGQRLARNMLAVLAAVIVDYGIH